MVRYKRYKRRGGSTNVIKMRFQSFMDIQTSADSMQIITISAGGKTLLDRCPAQFAAYKYYKLGGISVKLVPASTLPVDPTGLSLEAGEPGVDPRDQLTPGMMRITNGEDVYENITGLSDSVQHALYNNMLLDPRWFKWMLQSGVKRYATPRYWQIGQLHQDKWPGSILNVPEFATNGYDLKTTANELRYRNEYSADELVSAVAGSDPRGFFQTGHTGRLSWLPTDGLVTLVNADGRVQKPLVASPPEIECMKILLPKAYKTVYYYRAFITETVFFREPLVQALNTGRPLDVFHGINPGYPLYPQNSGTLNPLNDTQTGGNYGDD